MVGFTFGQPTATTSASGGFSFGQTASTSTSGFSFGLSTNTAASSSGSTTTFGQTTGGFNFGSTPQPTATATVSPLTQNTGTASASGIGGFSFGKTATTSSTGINFGLSNVASNQPAPASATTSTAATGGFFNFPQATTSSSTPGLSFGANQTSNATTTSTPSLFGQTNIASTPNLQIQTSGFGQTSAPAASSTGATGLFGLATSTQTTASLNFGLTTTSANANAKRTHETGLNFNAGTSGTGFSFSNPTTTSSATGFNLSSNAGLGGTTTSVGLGGSQLTSSSGLGGLQTSTSNTTGTGNTGGKPDGSSPKEAPLPQDIFATVSQFETYKDAEKKYSEENIRQTAAPFHKLVEDTKKLRQIILKLSNQHNQLHTSAQKLKSSVIEEAENVEMARRTQDTPMTLQGNNNAPEQFFLRLIRSFEERMTFYRNKIDEVDKCVRNTGSSAAISPEEMKEILKKEHNMIKVLAAKIYNMRNQLISYSTKSADVEVSRPDTFFKTQPNVTTLTGDLFPSTMMASRPSLGESGSGLLDFQTGQQKAKALSLGASPPTLPLSQTSMPSLFAPSNTSGLLSTSSAPGFGSLNFSSNTASNTANKIGFGQGTFGSTSFLGNQSQTPSAGFSFGNASGNASFIATKSLKK